MSSQYARIARVVKPYGTSGFFYVEPYSIATLSPLKPGLEVCIVPPMLRQERWSIIEDVKDARVKLSSINSRTDAEDIVARYLLVSMTSEIAKLQEEYLRGAQTQGQSTGKTALPFSSNQLIGYVVIDEREGPAGVIQDISDNGAHTLWHINAGKTDYLFPAVEAFVKRLDEKKQEADIKLPEGLLEEECLAAIKTWQKSVK